MNYECGISYAIYCKDGITIDVSDEDNIKIYGIDCSDLDILYDLIKADLVEKVGNDENN